MTAVMGCEDCRQTTSAGGCAKHRAAADLPGTYEATTIAHRHRWVFDGAINGAFVYHCDDHDPPFVRQVVPSAR